MLTRIVLLIYVTEKRYINYIKRQGAKKILTAHAF